MIHSLLGCYRINVFYWRSHEIGSMCSFLKSQSHLWPIFWASKPVQKKKTPVISSKKIALCRRLFHTSHYTSCLINLAVWFPRLIWPGYRHVSWLHIIYFTYLILSLSNLYCHPVLGNFMNISSLALHTLPHSELYSKQMKLL